MPHMSAPVIGKLCSLVIKMDFNPYDNFVFFDSCAFDGGTVEEQTASLQAQEILEKNKKKIMVMYSVDDELKQESTPNKLKELGKVSRKTVKLNLTQSEKEQLDRITEIIVGNGKPEKRKADCLHVFEAQKYGGCFITSDKGIYKHASAIFNEFGLFIVTPSEFLAVLLKYSEQT